MPPRRLLLCLLALPLLAPSAASAANVTVTVGGDPLSNPDVFTPNVIRINPGDTVNWTWRADAGDHTVTARRLQTDSFDSRVRSSGTFPHTFTKRGRFRYVCEIHFGMTGRVDVGPPPYPDVTLPSLTRLSAKPSKPKRSTKLVFRLSEAAKVKVVISRAGRVARSFTRSRGRGKHSIKLSVRHLRNHRRYRATVRPVDGTGNRGPRKSTFFRVNR